MKSIVIYIISFLLKNGCCFFVKKLENLQNVWICDIIDMIYLYTKNAKENTIDSYVVYVVNY